jgi:mono/diheme cytochrome c family protein
VPPLRPYSGTHKMMTFERVWCAGAVLTAVLAAIPWAPGILHGQSAPDQTDAGKQVFKRANCMGCHKWHGNGGGGYGGDALSLRKTDLTREQIIEVVGCGRPGTGMPFFIRGAYDTSKCYDMNRTDVGDQMPPEGGTFLRPNDIAAVADYVMSHIKGNGEPTYAECTAFFSDSSRVCDIYKTQGKQKPADATASTGTSQ